MHRIKGVFFIAMLLSAGLFASQIKAQGDLVASLETLAPNVEMKRTGTDEWLPVAVESLVGVGDTIRTATGGRARITFFANGTDAEILPETEFRIDEFTGNQERYQLSVSVLVGQTRQRIARLLDNGSSYRINSSGLEMAVRGTELQVRVEKSGRSATLVQTGLIRAQGKTAGLQSVDVPAGFGVRAEAGKAPSDVVRATTFGQLDAALDGCGALISTVGDVLLNVRLGPALSFPRVGNLDNNIRIIVIGETETTKWYRIEFKSGFAWIYAPALVLDRGCAGLRKYSDRSSGEDPTLYRNLDRDIPQPIVVTPGPTIQPTPGPTRRP